MRNDDDIYNLDLLGPALLLSGNVACNPVSDTA